MKKFRFKYAPSVWILLSLVLLLSVAGLIWNIFNLTSFLSLSHTFKIISSAIISIICLFLTAFVLSVLFYGNYIITLNWSLVNTQKIPLPIFQQRDNFAL